MLCLNIFIPLQIIYEKLSTHIKAVKLFLTRLFNFSDGIQVFITYTDLNLSVTSQIFLKVNSE